MHFPAPAILLALGASSLASARAIDAWGRSVYTEHERWGMPQGYDKGRAMEDRAQPPFHHSIRAQPTPSLALETTTVNTKTISIATTVTDVPMSSTTISHSTTTTTTTTTTITHLNEDLVKVFTLSTHPVPTEAAPAPHPFTGLKYCDGGRKGDFCTGDCNSLKEPGKYYVNAHCVETNGKVLFSVCDGSFNLRNWSPDGDCHYAADFRPAIRADGTHVYSTPGTHRIYFDPNPLNKWAKDIDWVDKMVMGREG